jgi:hypothetical protein
MMQTHRLALVLLFASISASSAFAANTVPCEKILADLRAAQKTVKVSDADAAKVAGLEDKGIERCNADDDGHADEFFSQAMKILSK